MGRNVGEKVFDTEPVDAHFRALKVGTTHDFLLFLGVQ